MPNHENAGNRSQRKLWNGRKGAFWAREQDRYDRMLAEFGPRLLEAVDIRPNQRILAVGCGGDAMTIDLAERVGEDGYVLGLDISMRMLGRAQERFSSTRHRQIHLICADAQTCQMLPASIDAVISRFGMTFFDDSLAAFTNLASTLRPSGRLGFVCWQHPDDNEWVRLPWDVVAEHLHIAPSGTVEGPGPFAFADPKRIHHVLQAAGFADIQMEAFSCPVNIGTDVTDVVRFLCEGDIRSLLEQIPTNVAKRITNTLRQRLRAYECSDGVVFGSAAWLVTAHV